MIWDFLKLSISMVSVCKASTATNKPRNPPYGTKSNIKNGTPGTNSVALIEKPPSNDGSHSPNKFYEITEKLMLLKMPTDLDQIITPSAR